MIPPSVIVVEDAVYPETADMPAGDSDTPLQEVEEGRYDGNTDFWWEYLRLLVQK